MTLRGARCQPEHADAVAVARGHVPELEASHPVDAVLVDDHLLRVDELSMGEEEQPRGELEVGGKVHGERGSFGGGGDCVPLDGESLAL